MNEWIALAVRMPEKGSTVLVFGTDRQGKRERMDVSKYDGHAIKPGLFFWDSHIDQLRHEITHWMPLPESPERRGESQ